MRCFIYWRYFAYAAGAATNNDSYFIENQELQLSSDSKVGSKIQKSIMEPFERVLRFIFCKKKSENPSQFVEGIILDDDVTTTESDNNMAKDFSGFDLVMGLGSASEDSGLDLVRGNNEDDENRRLRKLNQDSLTTVEKI